MSRPCTKRCAAPPATSAELVCCASGSGVYLSTSGDAGRSKSGPTAQAPRRAAIVATAMHERRRRTTMFDLLGRRRMRLRLFDWLSPPGEQVDQHRQYHQNQEWRQKAATDNDNSERLLYLRTDAGRQSRGQEADAGDDAGHRHRAHLHCAGAENGRAAVDPGLYLPVEVSDDNDPVHGGDAEQCDKADRRRYAERGACQEQGKDAADQGHRHGAGRQHHVAHRAEVQKQQDENQCQTEGHCNREPSDRLLQLAELADPLETVAGWQLHLPRDFLLGFEDGSAEVAFADAEFDRDIALLILPIDEGRSRDEPYGGDVGERYRHNAAAAGVWRADRDAANSVEALAIVRREAHDHRKVPIATLLVEIAGCLAADRSGYRRVDVAGGEPVARGSGAVDVDLDRRLAK